MVRADLELAASGIAQRALKAGDHPPDFLLPDARGGHVRSKDLLAIGPSSSVSTEEGGAHMASLNLGHCRKLSRRLSGSALSWSPFRPRLRMRAFRPRRRINLLFRF